MESWLANHPTYSAARKQQIRDSRTEVELPNFSSSRVAQVKSHIKDEFQDAKCGAESCLCDGSQYPFPRSINSHPDHIKAFEGALVDRMNDYMFSMPCFIKHVPCRERPAYQERYFSDCVGGCYVGSDFTSFERHFDPALEAAVEFQLYAYLLKNHPNRDLILSNMSAQRWKPLKLTFNYGKGSDVQASIPPVRMSGEMTTSLGNGFSNLMMVTHACNLRHIKVKGLVEGDDGLYWMSASPDAIPSESDWKLMGCKIKLERADDPSRAGFCSSYYSKSSLHLVANPVSRLVSIGWSLCAQAASSWRVRMGLLRAKGISLLYEFPSAPVLTALASWILRCTSRVRPDFRGQDRWWVEQLAIDGTVVSGRPADCDRELVADLFGLDVPTQLLMERWFDSQRYIVPMPAEWASLLHVPQVHMDCWQRFVHSEVSPVAL